MYLKTVAGIYTNRKVVTRNTKKKKCTIVKLTLTLLRSESKKCLEEGILFLGNLLPIV